MSRPARVILRVGRVSNPTSKAMFSHQFYNVVHIVGLILLMAGLGGIAIAAAADERSAWTRRFIFSFHGVGVFLVLLGGFGMLARLGIVQGSGWPGWVWGKVLVWGVLAIAAVLPLRYPRSAAPLMLLLPLLGGAAAYLAIYKPF